MKDKRIFRVLFALVLVCCVSISDAAKRIDVARHDVSLMNPGRARMSSARLARSGLGGVAFQGESLFIADNGVRIAPNEIALAAYSEGTLWIGHAGWKYAVEIKEDTFDRIFSWVNNKGTGLYTAYDDVPKQDLVAGGFVTVDDGGAIAAEFSDSEEIIRIATYLDFFSDELTREPDNATQLLATHNEDRRLKDDGEDYNWIVSDLDSDFAARLRRRAESKGVVELSGVPYVYYRAESNDPEQVFFYSLRQFRLPTQVDAVEIDRDEIELHLAAIRLAQTAAMLRSIYRHNQPSWNRFSAEYFTEIVNR